MFNVFRLYTTGKGVKADAGQARKWLEKAAAAGSIDAKKELMEVDGGDDSRPGQDLENAAYAAYRKKDYATSVRLYRQASDLGNLAATVVLGQHYAQGLGVGERFERSGAAVSCCRRERQFRWPGPAWVSPTRAARAWPKVGAEMRRLCEQSAAQYDKLGLNCVGRLYQFGMAVPMDRAKRLLVRQSFGSKQSIRPLVRALSSQAS